MEVTDGTQKGVTPPNNGVAVIKVIGIGGGGGNTVQHMVEQKVKNVDFIVVNTDLQALNNNTAENRVQIGVNVTRGLGSGSNPDVGRAAAEESREDLQKTIGSSDIVFITAGMGGGTGTGASPVVAQIARNDIKALTVAIVTKPFSFEGRKQLLKAEKGIEELANAVDALIVIPNDKLLQNLPKNISLINAFNECNHVLMRAVQGLSNLIANNGMQNVDFNDVKTILKSSGTALIGMGRGSGENGIYDAINDAIHSPLLEDISGCQVKGMLANISVSVDFPLYKYGQLGDVLASYVTDDTEVKYGINVDSTIKGDEVNVTILLAGLIKSANPTVTNRPKPKEKSIFVDDEDGQSIFGNMGQADVPPVENVAQEQPKPQTQAQEQNIPPFKKKKSIFDDGDAVLPPFLTKRAD